MRGKGIFFFIHILASIGIICAIASINTDAGLIAAPFIVGGLWWAIRYITSKAGIDLWDWSKK